MRCDTLTGSSHFSSDSSSKQNIHENITKYPRHPDCPAEIIEVQTQSPVDFALHICLPWWIKDKAKIYINGSEEAQTDEKTAFYRLKRIWNNGDTVRVFLPQGISIWTLP